MRHREIHNAHRVGWLRASVLGANDGIVSTASLVIGVASAAASHGAIVTAGLAGLVAGAMSMAAGEFVSVSSQKDAEQADLEKERQELEEEPEHEREELIGIYEGRGLDRETAVEVARQLMEHDALEAHARDELGIVDGGSARPLQAAWASAATFAIGAAIPLVVVLALPVGRLIPAVAGVSLVALAVLGVLGARAGGASPLVGAARVTFWGALAMIATSLVGNLFGTAV
jgi:VIT1/CCC1 family predicted Fe2+/Mn2+ transporter